jgi:hypothetical protein
VKSVDRTGFNSVGVVKEPRIDIKLKKSGAYVVRIQCAGNSARSEELTFNILPSESKEWKIPVAQPKKSISTKKTAELKKSADPKSNPVEEKEKPLAPVPQKLPVSETKDVEN